MIDEELQRSLYNWMMDGIISRADAKKIVDSGKIQKGKEKLVLVPFSDLRKWKVVS